MLRKRVIFKDTFQEKDAFCIRKHKIQHSTFLDFVSHHLSFNFHGPSQVNLVIIAPQTTLFPLILARCTHGEIYFFQWWYHLPQWHTTITQHQYISLFSFPLPVVAFASTTEIVHLIQCHHPHPTSRKSLTDIKHCQVSLCSPCTHILEWTTYQDDCSHAWSC